MKLSTLLESVNQELPEGYEDCEVSYWMWLSTWAIYKISYIKGYIRGWIDGYFGK